MNAIDVVKQKYPRAVCNSDYSHEACWSHVYDDHDDEYGWGIGNIIGYGQFEDEAWQDACNEIKKEWFKLT